MVLSAFSGASARRLLLAAGVAAGAFGGAATSASAIQFEALDAEFADTAGAPVRQAGAHADVRVKFKVPLLDPADLNSGPLEQPHQFEMDLPPGLVGDPTAAPTCSVAKMKAGPNGNSALCPVEAQVGFAKIASGPGIEYGLPIYNLERPEDSPGIFAFNIAGVVVRIVPSVRGGDYGITVDSGTIATAVQIDGADVTLWGVPADTAHDPLRAPSGNTLFCFPDFGFCFNGGAQSTDARKPFLSLPTSCASDPLRFTARMDGWQSIGNMVSQAFTEGIDGLPFVIDGCDALAFEPTVETHPTSTAADAPSGLEVDLRVPQNDDPDGLAASHVKDVTMVLPEGMSVSPSSAAGLGACSPAKIGLGTDDAPDCPSSSKLGTVTVETPLLDEPLTGDVLLATPDQNPFGSLVALYIVAEGSGVRVKLPGRVDPNPVTGQLTATFSNNPQLPFSALKVRFDGGENASLATPTACGRYEAKTTVTSWSGKSVALTSPMVVDQNCGPRGFAPGVNAGSVKPLAAKDSPFVLNLDRPDGQQNYADVGVTMPPGLLARISDIDLCGAADAAAGSCNDRSLIGSVFTTAGPGSTPLPVRGKAYLTGPYKGAPFGISIVVPTAGQAGPFDLGNVVVRARINVDRTDAHVTVTSDPMPTILRGFPLRIRQVQVAIDHGRFMLNPSSCKPMNVGVAVRGTEGGLKDSQVPYRVTGCDKLVQDQKISIGFTNKAQQRPGKHPGVEAKLTSKGPGGANLKKVAVKLPLSVALDPKNAKALCKPAEREAKNCPAASIVGQATAKSVLKEPLSGPVYFVEGTRKTASGRTTSALPKLWIPLSGGGVTIDVNADSTVSQRKLVSTFDDLPDAPIYQFNLRLNSGKNGILTVPPSKDGGTCERDRTIDMQLTGHNGAVKTVSSKVKVAGCKTKKKSSSKGGTKKSASAKRAPAARR